jgi:hypothetical protein
LADQAVVAFREALAGAPTLPTRITCPARTKQTGDQDGAIREFERRLPESASESDTRSARRATAARYHCGCGCLCERRTIEQGEGHSQASVFAVNAGVERLRQHQLAEAIARFREVIVLIQQRTGPLPFSASRCDDVRAKEARSEFAAPARTVSAAAGEDELLSPRRDAESAVLRSADAARPSRHRRAARDRRVIAGLHAAVIQDSAALSFSFNIAHDAGLDAPDRLWRRRQQQHLLETTARSSAHRLRQVDGRLDLFFVNGSTLEKFPRPHAHQSNLSEQGGRHVEDVTASAGLGASGWGRAPRGDFDNDGNDDLFVTYWGQNHFSSQRR